MPTTLALIAHDSQKDQLVEFFRDCVGTISRYELVATEGTGSVLTPAGRCGG